MTCCITGSEHIGNISLTFHSSTDHMHPMDGPVDLFKEFLNFQQKDLTYIVITQNFTLHLHYNTLNSIKQNYSNEFTTFHGSCKLMQKVHDCI